MDMPIRTGTDEENSEYSAPSTTTVGIRFFLKGRYYEHPGTLPVRLDIYEILMICCVVPQPMSIRRNTSSQAHDYLNTHPEWKRGLFVAI